MSKRSNKTLIQIRFIDLMNHPFPNLYHEVRVSGNKYAASAGKSDNQGLGVWIEKPIGTQLDILVRNPLTKKLVHAKHRIIVPVKKGVFRVQAPFAIQKLKLRQLSESGSTLRKTYKIESGDDLYSIAKKFETTWQILFELNKDQIKKPDEIFPGQWIKIPPKGSSLTGKTNEKPDSLTSQTHYKVKKGETLSGISQRSGVSVEELQRTNGISRPEALQTGQTIKLRGNSSTKPQTSSKPNPVTKHKPTASSSDKKEGFFDGAVDTMTDIAKGTVGAVGGAIDWMGDGLDSLEEKAKDGFENLNEAISSGKNDRPISQIPTSTGSSSRSTTSTQSKSSSTPIAYTVKNGDTLSGIAQQHGVNTNDLARANNLKLTDTIHAGDKLKIPSGDSLNDSPISSNSSSQSSKTNKPIDITINAGNSTNGTPKAVATTNGSCVCKAHNLIWSGHPNVTCEFRKKVIEISQDMWPDDYLAMANNLMACMYFETARTFDPKKDNKIGKDEDGYGYIGLIQFGNDACTDLNVKKRQLVKMSAVEQLDWVKKYFLLRNRNKLITTLVGMYICINYPKNLVENRMQPNDVVYTSDKKAYRQNPSFFKEPGEKDRYELVKGKKKLLGFENGKTYIWEVAEEMQNFYIPGGGKENISFSSNCSQMVQPPSNKSDDTAPWMSVAIREGKQWKGIHEKGITDNYHQLVGINSYRTLVGSDRAWCASFINYCLKDSNYPMVTTNDPFDRVRAKSFRKDTVNFVRIENPVYGAIAVSKKVSHVCLVIGRKNEERFYRLGGNQDQMITVDSREISTYIYYYPTKSWGSHSKQSAPIVDIKSLIDKGLNLHDSTSTR